MLNVERKKFLKLIDELLGPIVPAFLGLVLEGNSQIRGEGGASTYYYISRHESPNLPYF